MTLSAHHTQTNERPIRILPPHLINRIAAGEVVERPASVIKELVENALDAGATRIEISASNGGRNLRVADNGRGMTPENAALAFYNHATSKIQEADDLDRITTLGFRGEALASIGSISRLTCLTRHASAAVGTKVTLADSGEPVLSEAGCAVGTVMEVLDLFYNTPARLKFLKRAQTELGHIEETVQFLALSHPEVRFSLTVNEKEVLKTSGSNALKRVMEEVLGLKEEKIPLVPITAEDTDMGLGLAGFVSEPGVMKSSKRWLMTYLNGRHVRCPILQKAIEAAYESLLPQGRYPVCVIFVSMPTAEVDVNVHPAKREVRYASGNTIFGFVRSGIRNSLSAQGIRLDAPPVLEPQDFVGGNDGSASFGAAFGGATTHPALSPSNHFSGSRFTGGGASVVPVNTAHSFPPLDTLPSYRRVSITDPQPVQAALGFYRPGDNATGVSLPAATGESSKSLSKPTFANGKFKVIGQLFNTYILLETVQGLLVVDQHIASERDFFESLTLNLTAETPDIQRLVTALPLTVSPVQRDLLRQYQADFARLGFLYTLEDAEDKEDKTDESASSGQALQLTGYPLIYAGRDGMFQAGGLFENLLAQLEETGEMKLDLDHLIATLACHSAVRAGDSLNHFEMERVIERWLACQLPWTCPHGRPIAHTISTTELNQFFHRPSLPVNAF